MIYVSRLNGQWEEGKQMMKRMLTSYRTDLIKLVFMSSRKSFFLLKVFAFTWITILGFLWLNAVLSQLSRNTPTTSDSGCCPVECFPSDHLFASEWGMSVGMARTVCSGMYLKSKDARKCVLPKACY